MTFTATTRLNRFLSKLVQLEAHEFKAVLLAFLCNFVLLACYYILRPVRDTMATVFGVGQLQHLFTLTFVATLVCAPTFVALASKLKLTKLLPGIFWFWLINVLVFYFLFKHYPQDRWIAGAYYVWFSVTNLFMISIFWSLMVDLFSSTQATRLFAFIAAGGSLGAIAGPLITRICVNAVEISGLLLIAAAGLGLVIMLIHLLMREKEQLRMTMPSAPSSTFDHHLGGNLLDGFRAVFKSSYMLNQAAFMLLMTWIATIAYFLQTDLVTKAFSVLSERTQAIADIDLVVNICSALVLILGLSRFVQRFGVTSSLLLNPLFMILAFIGVALSPSLLMLQAMQIVRRVSQYAIARPSREMCFTVVSQEHRYKAKNIIDTVVYRFGDVTAAWMQTGLNVIGLGFSGTIALGLLASSGWGVIAVSLGRRYEKLRASQSTD
jgi:AAA family ATP:ADP antiporter